MSLEVNNNANREWRSYSVSWAGNVADLCNKRESAAVLALLITPIVLSVFILMDAIRGMSYLIESYDWDGRSVENLNSVAAQEKEKEIDIRQEILNKA